MAERRYFLQVRFCFHMYAACTDILTHRQAEEANFDEWADFYGIYPRPKHRLPLERL